MDAIAICNESSTALGGKHLCSINFSAKPIISSVISSKDKSFNFANLSCAAFGSPVLASSITISEYINHIQIFDFPTNCSLFIGVPR
jgi:hypothetical protein